MDPYIKKSELELCNPKDPCLEPPSILVRNTIGWVPYAPLVLNMQIKMEPKGTPTVIIEALYTKKKVNM